MDRYVEDALGLLAILVLLPIVLFIVLPATFLFDAHIGVFRTRRPLVDVKADHCVMTMNHDATIGP